MGPEKRTRDNGKRLTNNSKLAVVVCIEIHGIGKSENERDRNFNLDRVSDVYRTVV